MSKKRKKTLINQFLIWRIKHIPNDKFIYFISIFVGFLAGILAILLKNLTSFFRYITEIIFIKGDSIKILYLILPLVGIFLTYCIVHFLIKKNVGHGIPETLFAISKRKGIIPFYRIFSSLITAPVTVGFGGSVGLEGPSVSTGTAMASSVSKFFHLNQANRTLLLGCAAAGAMSAMFKAPIAAIVFAIEVFSLDLTLISLLPLLFASISAILTSYLFLGSDILLPFTLKEKFELNTLSFYFLFAIFCGLGSLYFTKIYLSFEKYFNSIKKKWKKILGGGLALGILIYLIPPLYGEGFDTINYLLEGNYEKALGNNLFSKELNNAWFVILLLLGMAFFKIIASALTFGSGGKGGVFAPALFMGSALGHCFAKLVNQLQITNKTLDPSHFTLVGMAGIIAGVLHAPLTAIFLIAELTGGYSLFLPLMITSAISFTITKSFIPYTVYTYKLLQKNQLITHDKDETVLTLMQLNKLIEKNFFRLKPEMPLGEMLKKGVAKSQRNLFPVVNQEKELVGILLLDDVREFMFDVSLYDTVKIESLMRNPPATILFETDNMKDVMKKFQQSGAWNLPVIKEGKYFGFISKSKLLTEYRKQLIDFTEMIS